MPTETFVARFENLARICEFVTTASKVAGFSEVDTYCVELATNEACTNIIEYSYEENSEGKIECSIEWDDQGVTIVLRDWGKPFDVNVVPEQNYDVPLEELGLRGAGLRLMIIKAPERLLTFVIVFAGVLSNMASEIGYVVLIPLGGIIFLAVGRHPVAGMAAAFAGVSGGYSANLLLGTIDPLLAGISTEAAQIIDVAYEVNPAANYYFMFVSTFFIATAGTWVAVSTEGGTWTAMEMGVAVGGAAAAPEESWPPHAIIARRNNPMNVGKSARLLI